MLFVVDIVEHTAEHHASRVLVSSRSGLIAHLTP